MLSLDFEKCFDKIEHCAILGALKYFKYAEYIVEWTEILYDGFEAKIQNNGFFSTRIPINRGCHQGRPGSSLYFSLCVEILARNLRDSSEAIEITVTELENLLGQYADDMNVFLMNEASSLKGHLTFLKNSKKLQVSQ